MATYNMAFAGFRHNHVYSLLGFVKANEKITILGGWEDFEEDKKLAEESYGINFCYDSYEDILNDDKVDIIAIGNYYGARGKMIIDALKHGKHIISDKPICTDLKELDEIEKLQKETNLSVFAMLDLRFVPNVATAKRLIEKGEIGEVTAIYFGGQHQLSYGTRPVWYFEEGKHGGTINDIAVHGIDIANYYTGKSLKIVNGARCWNKYATEVKSFKDSAQLMITLDGGAGVIADVSYASPGGTGFGNPYYWDFRVWGTEGFLSFTYFSEGVLLIKKDCKEALTIPGEAPEISYLDEFINEIEGRNTTYLSTKESLSSSRQVLQIQAYADKNED